MVFLIIIKLLKYPYNKWTKTKRREKYFCPKILMLIANTFQLEWTLAIPVYKKITNFIYYYL